MADYIRKGNTTHQIGTKMPSTYEGSRVTLDTSITKTTSNRVEGAIAEINSNLTNKIQASSFTVKITSCIVDGAAIGGYRSSFVLTNAIDPNYDSSVKATIVTYVSTANATSRPLFGSSRMKDDIWIDSANDITNQNVEVQVLYIR